MGIIIRRLVDADGALAKARSIALSLSRIYGVPTRIAATKVPLDSLYATELGLERGKLGLVLRRAIYEGYRVPITVCRTGTEFYVIDGHHRAYVAWLLGERHIDAYFVRFDEPFKYEPPFKLRLWELGVVNDEPFGDRRLDLWRFMAGVIVFYEKKYGGAFRLRRDMVRVGALIPTQKYLERSKLSALVDEPILCLETLDGKLYILDGHARSYKKLISEGEDALIEALVLYQTRPVKLGIERVVAAQSLSRLSDIVLV